MSHEVEFCSLHICTTILLPRCYSSNCLACASVDFDIVNDQTVQRVDSSLSTRNRESENSKLNILTALDRTRVSKLLNSKSGAGVESELLGADLLGIADRVVAALVSGHLDIASLVEGSGALAKVEDAREVEVLEIEGLGLAVLVVGGDHGSTLELRHEVGESIAVAVLSVFLVSIS